ncbi:nuclear transport factor 2 family protein [Streptomyces ipomoeae]|uniref:nuclear transport factor 2 family protein n=1 Tax=Streptomyces ipomoeae TaxID=103232 RepID=UPI0015EFEE53|nr:nuclear transport factor 2 family protein [Streptomyces ipomoeae]MDX2935560.1 nuclear transport factor 2 family protein [Streptomyces ipomoeae]
MPDRVADELAIRGLTARFNHMADQLRGADCAAAFTENGVLEAAGRLEGRAAIAAFFDAQAHGEPVDIGFGKTGHLFSTVHATTDNVITIEGDKATQVSYMLVFRQVPRELAREGLYVITHRWDDRLVRTDAGWLFEHRIMNVLQTNANPDATAQNLRLPTHP